MTTFEFLKQFPVNKGDVQAVASELAESINEGTFDVLKMSIRIKALETCLDQVKTMIKDYSLDEADKEGKNFDKEGVKVEVCDLGVKWDFSACNDSIWAGYQQQVKAAEDNRKQREVFLKAIPEGGTVDPETGELIYRPVRMATRGLKITLK